MTEIAQELRLAPSTVRRLLLTLVRHGLLQADAGTSTYSVAPATERLVAAAAAAKLVRAAREPLDGIAKVTDESVILAVLDGGDCVHVDVRHSRQFVTAFNPVGFRIASHLGGAIGKVLLAWLPEAKIRSLLPEEGTWKPLTPRAAHSTPEFLAELAAVRRHGYAINDGATHNEAWTVGAPVRDADGYVMAALLVAVPQSRASAAMRKGIKAKTVSAAYEISERLGYRTGEHAKSVPVNDRRSRPGHPVESFAKRA